MNKLYSMALLLGLAALPTLNARAIDPPTIGTEPVDGGVYVLFNYEFPNSYWSTTSWDGSYYLLGFNDSNWRNAAFTAHKDDTGWYFTSNAGTYLGYNLGDANLKGNLANIAHYELQTDEAHKGFYRIVNGKDQTETRTVGLPIHLNNGGLYVVTTFDGNGWFPDYYGGSQKNEETGWITPADTNHEYWAFADTSAVVIYHMKYQLYEIIDDVSYEVEDEVFGNGYQGLIDALTAIYNRDNFSAADYNEAEELAKAKESFMDVIEKAQEELEKNPNSLLSQAIEDATRAFNSDNTVAALTSDIEALTNVLNNYKSAQGDYTYLIQNPSFEDLSGQGGSNSNGMAGVPTGWTLVANGTEYAAGTTPGFAGNWCAINEGDGINVQLDNGDIVTRQPVDGTHLWGIWAGTMPTVELYQTITGLPKGIYQLKANVMVQNSWAGSNLTTQRLFANDFVEMWGQSSDYTTLPDDAQKAKDIDDQKTDTIAHLSYAGYVCEGSICDLLRPMKVNFRVGDDGVAKIGFRTEGDNAGNGHGWFKLDNFTLVANNAATGIKGVSDTSNTSLTSQEFYTLDGQRVAKPEHGIVITKNHFSDGSVKITKSIVK